MIDTITATQHILDHVAPPKPINVPLQEAIGRILMQDVLADMDFPPFNRIMMDGIAIRYDDFKNGCMEFEIEGIQAAGSLQKKLSGTYGKCLEVMTGAILPENADTVVPYEWVEIKKNKAIIANDKIVEGKNVHQTGTDNKKGEMLIKKGVRISAADIAVMATVGMSEVTVSKHPAIALISTGDELVEIDQQPEPYQIRKSNVYALEAELKSLGLVCDLYHLKDEKEEILRSLEQILNEHEVLLLSGGVSKGKYDYIPEALETLGIKKIFHRVKQKPGKPLWFGRGANNVVFAFPGNPVSVFMCFHKYFVPWLKHSLGINEYLHQSAVLAEDFNLKSDLTYFLQVEVKNIEGKMVAHPQKGKGSGDFANLSQVTGFMELPPGKSTYKAGEVYTYIPFRKI